MRSGSVQRPAIPQVAWLAAAMWCGCAVGGDASWQAYRGESLVPALIGPCLLVGGCALLAKRVLKLRALAVMAALGLLAGLAVSGMQAWEWHRQSAAAADAGAREWSGRVVADPMPGAFGPIVALSIRGGPLDGGKVSVRWPQEASVPELGTEVTFAAILRPLPEDEDWARRAAAAGTCATGTAWRVSAPGWEPGIRGALLRWRSGVLRDMRAIAGAGGDLTSGIVLGDRRRLIGTRAEDDFRVLGLTHLVAVSGSHLALACGAVAAIGRMLRMRRRPLVVTTVLAGAAYAVVTGMPYSALRSLLMLAVLAAGQLTGRRPNGVAALAAAVIAVLALDPWAVFDLGLQLSVLAVGGLLLFGRLAGAWAAGEGRGVGAATARVLALTLVAQCTTTPVVASSFGMVSLLAPVANALAAPLVSVALWLGLSGAVVGTFVGPVGALFMRACAAVLACTAWLARVLAALPGAAIAADASGWVPALTVLAAVLVWATWPLPPAPRARRRLAAAVAVATALAALGPVPVRDAELVVLDVGQGDALLLRDGGRSMLVDAGASGVVLRRALAACGVRTLDIVVLTHLHDDHVGGLRGLQGVVRTGWVGVPGLGEADAGDGESAAAWAEVVGTLGSGVRVRALAAGDGWTVGRTSVRVLWPPAEREADLPTNDTSVVLEISRGRFDAVLTGDAERLAQEGMAESGLLRDVEVLKVPHHGSANGLTADALEEWKPAAAAISVGRANDFGHPAAATLAMLRSAGCAIWRTDRSGDIVIEFDGDGFRVRGSARGSASVLRARMAATRAAASSAPKRPGTSPKERRGGQRHRGSQARLPDLRGGRPLARARAPTPASAHRRGRRPRLQLGLV